MSDETLVLYRPVGPEEFALLAENGYRRWPPRLAEQPFFYPVGNERYAREISERWNVPASDTGFVMKFKVKKDFMDRYPMRRVGDQQHMEWWIPASDLEELNDNIVGLIEVVGAYP